MKNTKVIELLKSLTAKEFEGFEDFVSSKFFNKNTDLTKLFSVIKKYYPAFENDNLDKGKIFVKIFGKKKYDDEKMRTIISNLMKLCKKYLIQLELEAKKEVGGTFLLAQLRKRYQSSLFDYEFNKLTKVLDETYERERDYYFLKFVVEYENYYSNPTAMQDNYLEVPYIEKVSENFEKLFLLDAMEINYHKLTRRSKLSYNPDFLYLEEIKKRIENGDYSDAPLIPLKYYIFMAVGNPDKDEYYEIAEKIYLENVDSFSPYEQASLSVGLTNYCWVKTGRGEEKYLRKAFDLYKLALEKGMYFYANRYLLPSLFNGIVKVASYLKEHKWLFNFITEYKNKLEPEQRQDVLNIAYSKYYLDIGKYDDALAHINKIKTPSSFLKLEIKILSVKIFYELGYTESIYSALDSIKHFLRNNSLLHESLVKQSMTFAKYIKGLIDFKEPGNKAELEYLRKEINDTKEIGFINTRWLNEKIDEQLNKK